jgi:Ca2+-binding RTX toxin-like protein
LGLLAASLPDSSSGEGAIMNLGDHYPAFAFVDWAALTAGTTGLDVGGYDMRGEPLAANLGELNSLASTLASDPVTVAQALAIYNANPQTPPLAVADTAANVAAGLDSLQVLTVNGALASITLTNPPAPVLVNPTQLNADAATLALIAGPISLAVAANVDSLTVSGESGAYIVGNASFNSITLGNGNSTVFAGNGGSYIVVNGGGNEVIGGSGGNTIYAFGGNNYLQGGAGSPSDVLVASGSGINEIYGGSGNNYIVGGTGSNVLVGGGGINSIYGNGSAGDYLVGGTGSSNALQENGTGNAQLWGGAGNNYIVGGSGDDLVVGGASNDYLFGGPGKDTIIGGGGTDAIYPGAGNDFIWTDTPGLINTDYIYETPGTGVDTIADFTPGSGLGHDVIVLSGLGNLLTSFPVVQGRYSQVGVYTELPITSTDQIYLYNVIPAQLSAANFIFE